MRTSTFLISSVLAFSGAQGAVNTSFEETTDTGAPVAWTVSEGGFEIAIDSDVAFAGDSSIRFVRGDESIRANGSVRQVVSLGDEAVDYLRVSARVRVSSEAIGNFFLWAHTYSSGDLLSRDTSGDQMGYGDSDWLRLAVAIAVPEGADEIGFGFNVIDGDTVWLDELEVVLVDIGTLAPATEAVTTYIDQALSTMEERSIRRDSVDWAALRAEAERMSVGLDAIADAHPVIREAIRRLGDNHSQLFSPEWARRMFDSNEPNDATRPWVSPEGAAIDSRIGYVSVPAYIGTNEDRMSRFATEIQSEIADVDSPTVCAWIIDLRRNGGGTVFPMLAGLGPILGEGLLNGGRNADGTINRSYYSDGALRMGRNGFVAARVNGEPYQLINPSPPVAVLIGPGTASSGEATALAFIGRENTRVFGTPSAGLTTGNSGRRLSDGAYLNLATSVMTDRNGTEYGAQIQPDVAVEPSDEPLPLEAEPAVAAAVTWLGSFEGCAPSQ
jgi:hypothetical protein